MVGMASKLVMPNKYTEIFQSYIASVEEWLNTGIIPKDDAEGQHEFYETVAPEDSGALYYPVFFLRKKDRSRIFWRQEQDLITNRCRAIQNNGDTAWKTG